MNVSFNSAGTEGVGGMMQRPPGPPRASEEMQGVMSELKGDTEVREFMGEMKDAIKSGTFDAAEFAANAPQAMQDLAAEQGVDLEEQFSNMADKAAQMKEKMSQFSVASGSGEIDIDALMQQRMSMFEDNTESGQFSNKLSEFGFSTTA